jgi:hypothetical protein
MRYRYAYSENKQSEAREARRSSIRIGEKAKRENHGRSERHFVLGRESLHYDSQASSHRMKVKTLQFLEIPV